MKNYVWYPTLKNVNPTNISHLYKSKNYSMNHQRRTLKFRYSFYIRQELITFRWVLIHRLFLTPSIKVHPFLGQHRPRPLPLQSKSNVIRFLFQSISIRSHPYLIRMNSKFKISMLSVQDIRRVFVPIESIRYGGLDVRKSFFRWFIFFFFFWCIYKRVYVLTYISFPSCDFLLFLFFYLIDENGKTPSENKETPTKAWNCSFSKLRFAHKLSNMLFFKHFFVIMIIQQ